MRRLSCVAALAVMVAAACTPSSSEPPNPTLTPANPTPTEGSFERQQRLDFEAAEKSYREFRAEYDRVLRAGGARSATATMKKTAGGSYLPPFVDVVQGYRKLGYVQRGSETVVKVVPTAHYETQVTMSVCEDSRAAKTYDADGKLVASGEMRTADLTVRNVDGVWKIWSGSGRQVSQCP